MINKSFKIPMELYTNIKYFNLTDSECILYAIILDYFKKHKKRDVIDCEYTIWDESEMSELMRCNICTTSTRLGKLEKIGLIKKEKTAKGFNKIYIKEL